MIIMKFNILGIFFKTKEKDVPIYKGKILYCPKKFTRGNWRGPRIGLYNGPGDFRGFPAFLNGKKVRLWVDLNTTPDEQINETLYYGAMFYTHKRRK